MDEIIVHYETTINLSLTLSSNYIDDSISVVTGGNCPPTGARASLEIDANQMSFFLNWGQGVEAKN